MVRVRDRVRGRALDDDELTSLGGIKGEDVRCNGMPVKIKKIKKILRKTQ
jgi:hypothetical protein